VTVAVKPSGAAALPLHSSTSILPVAIHASAAHSQANSLASCTARKPGRNWPFVTQHLPSYKWFANNLKSFHVSFVVSVGLAG
jgi:hypothetical protein